MKKLEQNWTKKNAFSILLLPLSALYALMINVRRLYYKVIPIYKAPVPVIIVGNLSVGGTGKTPLVSWLARQLVEHGFKPGIVSRGYRGNAKHWPQEVTRESDPWLVGDEPLLHANTDCPVFVAPQRAEAIKQLLQTHACDVIIADDGLQHYALARDIEVIVYDSEYRFGNGYLLPAGPLREPVKRLKSTAFVVANGGGDEAHYEMKTSISKALNLLTHEEIALASWQQQKIHALAGVGRPKRFFQQLRAYGIIVIAHEFPDHHLFTQQDLRFGDDLPVVMTEKDAVKCQLFISKKDWVVPLDIDLDEVFVKRIIETLKK